MCFVGHHDNELERVMKLVMAVATNLRVVESSGTGDRRDTEFE